MTASFSRFSAGAVLPLATALPGIAACAVALTGTPLVAAIFAAGAAAVAAVVAARMQEAAGFRQHLIAACTGLRRGDFEQRIIMPDAKGSVGAARDALNGFIDVADAFVRESALATDAASKGRYYRKIRPEGLQGSFLEAAGTINAAIDQMADRQDMIDRSTAEVRRLAEAAAHGDLTPRIDISAFQGEHAGFTAAMNALMESVANPLAEASEALGRMAEADLTARMQGAYEGTFERLAEHVNEVGASMSGIVSRLRATSAALRLATSEILVGANDLSERTVKQAATVEETSAAVELLTETTARNSEEAGKMNSRAEQTSAAAGNGLAAMKDAAAAMQRISTSSKRISGAISLIDDIAFQTNLLALNASVEAARAGEAGLGFAVVAAEVRKLAGSAAEAAKQVKTLVEQGASDVSDGVVLLGNVSTELGNIRSLVEESTASMQVIASQAEAQATSIAEINIAIRQMDEMTQHNAALVEETNAAIEQTEAQASDLDRLVSTFRLDQSGGEEPRDAELRWSA